MNKKSAVKTLFVIITVFILISVTSCDYFSPAYSEPVISDKIVLLKNNNPIFRLVISDELMSELEKNNSPVLDSMSSYFEIIPDENIEPYVIYIESKVEKAEEVSAADMSLSEGEADNNEGEADEPVNLYDTADEVLFRNHINLLKYKDYYIEAALDKISIVGGSVDATAQALEYLNTKYLKSGTTQDGEFLILEPESEIHKEDYLSCLIAANSIERYSLVYLSNKQYDDGKANAAYLNEYLAPNFGVELKMNNSNTPDKIKYRIVVGKTALPVSAEYYDSKPDICSYKIVQSGNDLYILGGSDWAIQYAVDYLIKNYFSQDKNIPKGYSYEGSLYGEYLFEKCSDSDLRMMTNNVWRQENNLPAWFSHGEDCSEFTRLKNMAKVYMAYNPDVLSLQEINSTYVNFLIGCLNNEERNYKLVSSHEAGEAGSTYTPIIYNADEVTLLDSGSHVFEYGSDKFTKSYTWGYFKKNDSGKCFVAFSTHLWWMSAKTWITSTEYRMDQLTEIGEAVNGLIAKYDCPCFVLGDFNCKTTSEEYQVLSNFKFSDCYDIATEFSDDTSGTYKCNRSGFSIKPNGGTYKKNAIDHIVVKNLDDSQVYVYDYITPNFYGKLSDHAPLYIDVKLNQ